MSFIRTKSGLANQHIFYKVDFVVFVEGGSRTYTLPEIMSDKYSDESIDIRYWREIFGNYMSGASIKFKATGSKATLDQIAAHVEKNDIAGLLIAMDADFDILYGRAWNIKQVIYTYGYSWENDAWSTCVTKYLINEFSGENIEGEIIHQLRSQFFTDLRLFVYADTYLSVKNKSFFRRGNGCLKHIECKHNHCPSVKRDLALNELRDHKVNISTVYSHGRRFKVNARRDCYGRIVNDFHFHLVRYILHTRYNLPMVSKEILRRMLIRRCGDCMSDEILDHYNKAFARI